MKNVYAYIRVSTVKQGEHGSSLAEQRHAIEQYARRHDLAIVQWFEEKETAAKRGRKEFTRMLSLLLKGKAQGLVIHKIDRGARNLKDWADIGGLIDKGTEVHFAHESLDMQSRGGRLAADIQAVVAADYIRNLRDEVKKGFQGRLRQGLYPLPAPVGYLDQGKGLPKLSDPIMAPLVRRAFELYATGNHSLFTLGEEMYKAGLRNRRGGRVTRTGLSIMLNNEFYIGIIFIARTGERYPGVHTPIIKKSVFDRVNALLQGKTKNTGVKNDFRYRKALRCICCGYSLIGTLQKGRVYYRCQTRTCPTTCVREDRIDEMVQASLSKVFLTPAQTESLHEEFALLAADRVENRQNLVAGKELAIANIKERMARLTDAFIDRLIDKDTFDSRNSALLHEKSEALEALEQLKAELGGSLERPEKFLQLAKDIYQAVELGNELEKRDVLKSATSNLQIDGKSLIVTWFPPFHEVSRNGKIHYGAPYRDTPPTKRRKPTRFATKLYRLIQDAHNPSTMRSN